jgi:hypothetical protein
MPQYQINRARGATVYKNLLGIAPAGVGLAVLGFINSTNLDYIVSGNLKDYLSSFSVIANANGSFTFEPSGA